MKESLEKNQKRIIDPSFFDTFSLGNLDFTVLQDYVLAALAMPEMEDDSMIIKPISDNYSLWRGWVVAVGSGKEIYIGNNKVYYNPGIFKQSFIYFLPENGHYFSIDTVDFVFVSMSDVELIISPELQ